MKVLSLNCAYQHRFEGWFVSDADYASQGERGLLSCPMCGDKEVQRVPSAPRLNLAGARPPQTASTTPPVEDAQAQWLRAVHHLLNRTEDVGERFAEEARRIHYGEVKERSIRGRASQDEADALVDEGIQVASLPVPEALNGTRQ